MRRLVAMRPYILSIFTIVWVVLAECSSSEFSPDKLSPSSLKDLLTEAEWAHIIGADADLNDVSVGTLKRHKRDLHSHVSIESNSLPEPLGLQLSPSPDLVDPSFLLVRRWANRTDSIPSQPYTTEEERCLYRSDTAALSLCGRVRGIVTYNNSFYTVSSLPDRFKSEEDQHHIVLRRSASSADVYEDSLEENTNPNNGNIREDVRKVHRWTKYRRKPIVEFIDNIDINEEAKSEELNNYSSLVANKTKNAYNPSLSSRNKNKTRIKRSVVPAIFVETAVFVDRDLHKHMVVNYPQDTERELVRFVLAMINAVQLLYHDSTLGQTVNFVLKRLEILHEDPVNLKRPHDIDRFLSNFCAWQRLENPTGDTDPLHWDHALILTGLDLYVVSKHGKVSSQVVGLAPVAGMCTVTSSCTVNEGRHFESVYVVAHEIGHNLGMRHDGPLAENECDPSSYIMSPTLGSGKITWSPCSKRYLQSFLDTQQSRCLLDHGSSAGKLDHSAEGLLPGERFGADQQCMLKYGKESRHASQQPLSDVCRDLHCKRERYTWTSHPALEGTKCGEHKWCRGGRCIGRGGREVGAPPPLMATPGGWGTWTPWVECASGCLHSDSGRLSLGSTGITVSSRRCDSPRPENGGEYCEGHAKKFRTCIATQCLNVPRMTISEFSDQICLRAREVDPDLIGTGFQRYNTDAADACSVWCHTRGGGLKSRGWTFPDGTTCLTKLGKKPMHCISGMCVEFKCSNNEDLEYTSNLGQCVRDVEPAAAAPIALPLTGNPIPGPWRRSSGPQWLPASGCHYHCVSPGSGIRIVKSRGNEPKNSIQLCKPDEVGCGHLKTPHEHATYVCTKYKERVRRLSGVGMQISPAVEDPDRPCRIACQDEAVSHRFYLVNGQEGWFPFGTSCSKLKQAFCISGKCLEFGPDNTPLSESEFTLPLLPRNNKNSVNVQNKTSTGRSRPRYRRSISTGGSPTRIKVNLEQSHLDDIISKLNLSGVSPHQLDSISSPDKADIFVLDFNNPVYVTPEDSIMARVGRHFTYFDYDY